MLHRRHLLVIIPSAALLSLGLTACGGKHGNGPGTSGTVRVSAGADKTVTGSRPVRLFASSDARNPLYHWTLIAKPGASRLTQADIAGSDSATATLTPDVDGVYTLRLGMKADSGQASATVKITSRLAVDAGPDRTVQGAHPVTLQAVSNAATPHYQWSFVSRPSASRATLEDADAATARFTPDVTGEYRLHLSLDGGRAEDTVTINAEHVWQSGVDHEPPNETADATALAVAHDGVLYAAYRDRDKAVVKRFDGRSWSDVGGDAVSSGDAHYIALAVYRGTPYIAFQDFSDQGRGGVTVKKFDSGTWQPLGHAGFSAGEAGYIALAVAPDGTPYVAYQDFSPAGQGRLTVERFSGRQWAPVGALGFSPGKAHYVSLSIAGDGTPYVGYQDMHDIHMGIAVQAFTGKSWQSIGSAGFSAGTALFVNLALAPDGTPYVAYQDGGHEHPASVKRYRQHTWDFVGDDWFTRGEAEFDTLAFDAHGTPYLAFQDEIRDGASVMKFDGKQWRTVGQPGMSKGEAAGLSFVISPRGQAYVAYHDEGDGDRVTVMTLRDSRWVRVGRAPLSEDEEDDRD